MLKNTNEKKAFTLAEMIIVMVLIGFIWTVVARVMTKNMENKVQLYLFGVYNELQNAAKNVNTVLSKKPENKNKNFSDIMLDTNAISYCDAFVSNTNTYNSVDCIQGTSQFIISKDVKPNITNTYDCTRTYKYNVNSNGLVTESYIPSTSTYVNDISQYSESYKNLINDSAKTGDKYYNCTKTTEEIPKDGENEAGDFDLNQQIINRAFVSSNNVSFYFIATSSLVDNNYFEKDIYNYTANVEQDAICDAASTGTSSSSDSYKNLFIYNPYTSTKSVYGSGKINTVRFGSASSSNVGIFITQRGVNRCGETWAEIKNKIPTNLYNEDRCKTFFNLYQTYGNKQCCIYAYTNNGDRIGNSQNLGCWNAICQTIKIPCVQMPSTSNDPNAKDSSSFYNKWKNYFSRYFNNNRFYRASVKLTNITEGHQEFKKEINGTSSLTYPNHFIYISIDTPFKSGTYGKDVFAFEHFDSKIIPVGILAHDKNSPLKFNVITRNPDSLNIERLNDKPLNFCEAMKYTGEKFSSYCGCKDDSGNLIKQYIDNVNPKCKSNFGCIIRPVRPAVVRFEK